MKTFLENPELLFGAVFLAFGLVGMAVPLLAGALPARANAATVKTESHHPGDAEYIRIGLTLGAITAFEVALFYIEIERALLIPILVIASAAKFVIVMSFFMHLKFDSKLFTVIFVTGFALATAVFAVALSTLGGSLI